MYMKCLYYVVALTSLLVGLSACDEGRIADSYGFTDPDGIGSAPELTLMDAVQGRIFDSHCVQCHGGSNHAAAGLYLTAGASRDALIGQPSALIPGATLLSPGNHAESVLYRAVAGDVSTGWRYNHSTLLSEADLYLLATWIDLEN